MKGKYRNTVENLPVKWQKWEFDSVYCAEYQHCMKTTVTEEHPAKEGLRLIRLLPMPIQAMLSQRNIQQKKD